MSGLGWVMVVACRTCDRPTGRKFQWRVYWLCSPHARFFLRLATTTIEKQLLTNLQVGQKSLESRKGITTVKHFLQKFFSISLWLLANSASPATAGEAGLQWRREGARAAAPGGTAFEEAKIWNLAFALQCVSVSILIFNLFSALKIDVAGWRGGTTEAWTFAPGGKNLARAATEGL